MPPTIHIVRHAHAAHQIDAPGIGFDPHDPELTQDGIRECEGLAAEMATLGGIDLILCSPMKRTIQTALAAFSSYTESKKIVLLPDLQESGIGQTNTGSSLDELVSRFGTAALDFYYVTPDWTDNGTGTRYDSAASASRARATRLFIRTIAQHYRDTDANIVVVTHSLYIRNLVPRAFGVFNNTEWGSFRFNSLARDDGDAELREVPCSITRKKRLNRIPRDNTFNVSVPVPLAAKEAIRAKRKRDEESHPPGCSTTTGVHEVPAVR
ncbi:hypothetical protein ONZ43_g7405 [Nemania bipapillata]|uniref:Uncharacterized protein n=1 Tax=Nemania bipapillata TaxID=110536 RepID=A0ACC2HRZ8_9PEZI|nr:hypothetical protein ONZ43_g7405 [Nemania bipapillata]